MRALWTVALALTSIHPVAAQLGDLRPTHTAFAFGWSDVTGYGTALALLHRLPDAPIGLGVALGGGGVGAHAQVQLPDPFLPRRADHEPLLYLSVGLRSEEHTSELQSRLHLVCRLLLEKKKT